MLLILHILIALTGIVLSTLGITSPSYKKIWGSAALILLTLISGALLVFSTHSSLASGCIAGLSYTLITSVMIYIALRRLTVEKN